MIIQMCASRRYESRLANLFLPQDFQRLLPQDAVARRPASGDRQQRHADQAQKRSSRHSTEFGIVNARNSSMRTITFAKKIPTVPATSPSTANSIEKIVAIRGRVAPSVFNTTTSRIRR